MWKGVMNNYKMNTIRLMKGLINSAIEPLGLEVRRKSSPKLRYSMLGALTHIKKLGFSPKTIIDIGVAAGTHALYVTFPSSKLMLIEPLEEFKPYLDSITKTIPNSEYIIAAAARESGSVTINVHPDLSGSSIYLEDEDSNVNGVPRVVPAITLDELCREKKLVSPYLIKIDVQGSELDILKGGIKALQGTEYIILETVLFEFFKGGPQIFDILEFMKEHGFVCYDIFDPGYRLLDGAMSQVDIAFVKETVQFRGYHFYATREQREIQNKNILESLKQNK